MFHIPPLVLIGFCISGMAFIILMAILIGGARNRNG